MLTAQEIHNGVENKILPSTVLSRDRWVFQSVATLVLNALDVLVKTSESAKSIESIDSFLTMSRSFRNTRWELLKGVTPCA